jgi:hypothetical protein
MAPGTCDPSGYFFLEAVFFAPAAFFAGAAFLAAGFFAAAIVNHPFHGLMYVAKTTTSCRPVDCQVQPVKKVSCQRMGNPHVGKPVQQWRLRSCESTLRHRFTGVAWHP